MSNEDGKEAYIESLFSSIAPKYDLLNSVLSLTRHKAWRRFAVSKSGVKPGGKALDVCCGTGDFAFELARRIGSAGSVVGVDFSVPMIEIAKEKAARKGFDNVKFAAANACALPFEDDSFDCATVGFGLRNVTDLPKALSEMTRVVRPGGRVVNLEISHVKLPLLRPIWKFWFYYLTPRTASFFRAGRSAYEYLPDSVKAFMTREELAEQMTASGLVDVHYYDLMFGAVCVHIGTKR